MITTSDDAIADRCASYAPTAIRNDTLTPCWSHLPHDRDWLRHRPGSTEEQTEFNHALDNARILTEGVKDLKGLSRL
jgi:hypothetical protein